MTLAITTPDRHPTPTQDELESLLSEWQRRLRLQDWAVKIQLRRRHDMSMDDSAGVCRWQLPKKLACIEIMDPNDYDPGAFGWTQDIERTLVHELLHLHFAPFATHDQPEDTAQEQAIDLIARALVAAKREAPPAVVEFQPAGDPDRPAIQVVHVPADSIFDRTVKTS